MKPNHEERSRKAWWMWKHHIPQNIFFWKFKIIIRPLPNWQQDSLLLAGPGIYPEIYRSTPCHAVLFGNGVISYDNQVLLEVISKSSPPSCTFQKRPSSPLQFDLEENIPELSTERRTYWFVWKMAKVFPISTGKLGIGWRTLL